MRTPLMKPFHSFILVQLLLIFLLAEPVISQEQEISYPNYPFAEKAQQLLSKHPGQDGIYVLEKGEESLLSRAWLVDHAQKSIEIQYFIWSSDNIGILAAEALLRAAERGVKVRVIVDDLLIDAPDQFMLALSAHKNVEIGIYNPKHSVGVSTWQRVKNIFTEFRSSNQRMHDKTLIVDDLAVITGGRNMADEYFDYNQTYNFRDRDILVFGSTAQKVKESFERFWSSSLTVKVEDLLKNSDEMPDKTELGIIYNDLHNYAQNPRNFEPEVATALHNLELKFPALITALTWDEVKFISDLPGKNSASNMSGGGRSSSQLTEYLLKAKKSVTIQSPYLVMPDGGIQLFKQLSQQGVTIKFSTNSLASTDNLQAFSGYSKQRKDILGAGIQVFEYRPAPKIQQELIDRYERIQKAIPTFAIHAKTMVIDSEYLFIGTFNFDPRSVNLNTEVGVLIHNPKLAAQVEQGIFIDMAQENSWQATKDKPDSNAPFGKRVKVFFWKLLPLHPLL